MYIYTHVYKHMHVNTYVHERGGERTLACTNERGTDMLICAVIRTMLFCTYMHSLCMYLLVRVCVFTRICICIYVNICIYTHFTHTHTHTHTHT